MQSKLSTGEAAELIDAPPHQFRYVVRNSWIAAPSKNHRGFYQWGASDVRRGRKAVACIRPYTRRKKLID